MKSFWMPHPRLPSSATPAEPVPAQTRAAPTQRLIEQRGIEHIPDSERHGKASNQFSLWFSPNMQVLDIILGSIGVGLGLGLAGALTAMLVGTLLGALANSVCVAMGPRVGLPQMTMGRATFGYIGNYLPAFLATLLFIGYFAVNASLGAHTAQQVWHVPFAVLAVIITLIAIGVGLIGHDHVHRYAKWLSRISAIVFLVLTIAALVHGAGPAATGHLSGGKYWQVWVLQVTAVFAPAASFGPYASDYSRYLPKDTRFHKVFGYSFLGLFISKSWVQALGAVLTSIVAAESGLVAISVVSGWFGNISYAVILLAIIIVCVLNLYSGAMSLLTWDVRVGRKIGAVIVGVIGGVVAIFFGGTNFLDNLKSFLDLVAYFVTPWIAIIGIDFYWVRRNGRSFRDFSAFFRRSGFGLIRWRALAALLIGVGASVPFMASAFYEGPVGMVLHGADISYFVSFLVGGLIYLVLLRGHREPDPDTMRENAVTHP